MLILLRLIRLSNGWKIILIDKLLEERFNMYHMSTYELIEVCTNLTDKLHSINEDFLQIQQDCKANQEAFEDIQLGYALAIDYLSQQHFIQNNAAAFANNQISTNQKIGVLSGHLDLLKNQINVLVEQIETKDIRAINRTIEWLEDNPHP